MADDNKQLDGGKASVPTLPKVNNDAKVLTQTYRIKVITPLVGGGVDPGENDPVTLIRVPEIRGHLRFWWRATAGAQYNDSQALRNAEKEIWGDTNTPSRISLSVRIENQGAAIPVAQEKTKKTRDGKLKKYLEFQQNFPGYALFPFQGAIANNVLTDPPKRVTCDLIFDLHVKIDRSLSDKQVDEVKTSLWAWTNFGGLGARTRRGCGALYCDKFAPGSSDILEWLRNAKKNVYFSGPKTEASSWPYFFRFIAVGAKPQSPIEAWCAAVSPMQTFRQGKDIGRNGPSDLSNPKKMGRSLWPEADSLRSISGIGQTVIRDHRSPITLTSENLKNTPGFPRSEFGLPIVMHFMKPSEKELKPAGISPKIAAKETDSPNDCQLYPYDPSSDNQLKRMASPVILRPLAFGDGTKAVPLVLILNAPRPKGVRIESDTVQLNGKKFGEKSVADPCLADYESSPMKKYRLNEHNVTGSALESFMKFVQSAKGGSFKEVTL
ncbi:MAG: type III-B CRISPR module RAMP protein Cmr1 [Candidatus Sumerlaeaceae bacterium]|nr:type III-B CRISPR module RAMP protein Cmr1 [Candidatus Sumerlaeaceae bacterium]